MVGELRLLAWIRTDQLGSRRPWCPLPESAHSPATGHRRMYGMTPLPTRPNPIRMAGRRPLTPRMRMSEAQMQLVWTTDQHPRLSEDNQSTRVYLAMFAGSLSWVRGGRR